MRLFVSIFFLLFAMCSSLSAQTEAFLSIPNENKSYALLDLGFQAKLMHLDSDSETIVQKEEVKKSPRTLKEILATSKAKKKPSQYHLIAGCFSSHTNASRLVHQLTRKGYPSKILGKNDKGLYMVSYLSLSSYEAATEALSDLKSEGKSTWISVQ